MTEYIIQLEQLLFIDYNESITECFVYCFFSSRAGRVLDLLHQAVLMSDVLQHGTQENDKQQHSVNINWKDCHKISVLKVTYIGQGRWLARHQLHQQHLHYPGQTASNRCFRHCCSGWMNCHCRLCCQNYCQGSTDCYHCHWTEHQLHQVVHRQHQSHCDRCLARRNLHTLQYCHYLFSVRKMYNTGQKTKAQISYIYQGC